ncbi:hypothetical protein Nepgr_030353 [Nepenthes gracilis]|uniref:Uncharacterized protein n=1 Tax=Nepenthes gracilis TaxID=150966 RepID=A0AAD3TF57_NEPGR|nr:hypothetical protein Nepgr_030353 [Nepenthes gracilis]
MARIRRLSEPKSSGHHASSVSRSVESVPRRRISNGPDMKKMSAITNNDKTKSATLLELKIRTFKGSSDVAQKEPSTKDMTQKMNRNTYSNASASVNPNESNGKTSSQSDRDDNTVVEKTVVMLECGKPSIPVAHAPEEKISIQNLESDVSLQEGKVKESTVIQALASIHPTKEIGQESTECQQKGKSHFIEAGTANCEKVLPNISSISITEEPYQAPYARISSLEDPCTVKSKYGKALPMSLELATAGVETNTVHIPDSHRKNLDNMLEASNKPMRKESSKGLRGLLKFGKKNHNSTTVESNAENDQASLDDSKAGGDTTCAGVSGEVYTLKNLISVAETSSSSSTTPQKSSRTFSLFSPFKRLLSFFFLGKVVSGKLVGIERITWIFRMPNWWW